MRVASDFSLGFLDPCHIHHYIHFYVTYLHALMQVDHHSLFYLFVFFYLYFIPQFHSTSSDLFLFSSCLMFDLSSTSTVDPHPIHSDGATRYLFFKKVMWNGMEKWFSSFEKSVPDEERFCLESPLTSYFLFFKGEKLSKNKNP